MRTWTGIIPALLAAAVVARAGDDIAISATKRTADTRKGELQDFARGTGRSTKTSIYYRFDLEAQTANVPGYVTVQWMVLVEGIGGRIKPGTSGESNVHLPFRRTVSVETDTIELKGREWSAGPRPGTVEENVIGYAVRVITEDEAVLAEKYGPPSIESEIDWAKLHPPESKPSQNIFRRRSRRQFPMDPDQDPDQP